MSEMSKRKNDDKNDDVASAKQAKLDDDQLPEKANDDLELTDLPTDVLVRIVDYLTMPDALKCEHLHTKLADAVALSLQIRREIDVTSTTWSNDVPPSLDDARFRRLVARCPNVRVLRGLHTNETCTPKELADGKHRLSADGVLQAIDACEKLTSISTSSLRVLDAVLQRRPTIRIRGHFRNRRGTFPAPESSRLTMPANALLTQISLVGVRVPRLVAMTGVAELNLKWIVFEDAEPFKDLSTPDLQLFSMKHCRCYGDRDVIYKPLFESLADAVHLSRMDVARVPFPEGCLRAVVEAKVQEQCFQSLTSVAMSSCSRAGPADLFFPVLTSRHALERLRVQPSLSDDVFFAHVQAASVPYSRLTTLELGYRDDFPSTLDEWTEERLVEHGLEPYTIVDCPLTDVGMNCAFVSLKQLKNLHVYRAPALVQPDYWIQSGGDCVGKFLRDLTLKECRRISSVSLGKFISRLPALQTLALDCVGSPVADMVQTSSPIAAQAVIEALSLLEFENSAEPTSRLRLSSQSLTTVTIVNSSYAGVDVVDCPLLENFTVMRCASLNGLSFEKAPVTRCKIIECPRLKPSGFLPSFARLAPVSSRLIIYNCAPESVDEADIERLAFSEACDYHVAVIYDKVCPLSVRTDLRMRTWMEIVDELNGLLLNEGFPKAVYPIETTTTTADYLSFADKTEPGKVDSEDSKPDKTSATVTGSGDDDSATTTKKKTAVKRRGKAKGGDKETKKKKKKRVELPSKSSMEVRCGREVWRYEGIAKIDGELGDFVYVGDIPWIKELAETKLLRHWREAGAFAPTVPPVPVLRPEFTVADCKEKLKDVIEKRKGEGKGILERCLTFVVSPAKVEEQLF
ncbi:F-box only protein 38-like [Oscarella lobularis]|uniref:F-box only protein 38-like n=1 Tax=Oscarella lobularis TaxID=121494 RepID=UPI003313FE4E